MPSLKKKKEKSCLSSYSQWGGWCIHILAVSWPVSEPIPISPTPRFPIPLIPNSWTLKCLGFFRVFFFEQTLRTGHGSPPQTVLTKPPLFYWCYNNNCFKNLMSYLVVSVADVSLLIEQLEGKRSARWHPSMWSPTKTLNARWLRQPSPLVFFFLTHTSSFNWYLFSVFFVCFCIWNLLFSNIFNLLTYDCLCFFSSSTLWFLVLFVASHSFVYHFW